MTDRKTNLPEEPIFEEAEDDGCPSIENSSHLSVPTVEENKDFSEYNGKRQRKLLFQKSLLQPMLLFLSCVYVWLSVDLCPVGTQVRFLVSSIRLIF